MGKLVAVRRVVIKTSRSRRTRPPWPSPQRHRRQPGGQRRAPCCRWWAPMSSSKTGLHQRHPHQRQKRSKKQLLADNDTIEIGNLQDQVLAGRWGRLRKTMIMRPVRTPPMPALWLLAGCRQQRFTGHHQGACRRPPQLTKVALGRPGLQSRLDRRRALCSPPTSRTQRPSVNGIPLTGESIALPGSDHH